MEKTEQPKVRVEGFTKVWPKLNRKAEAEQPIMYQYAINCIKARNAILGFKAKKVCKPQRNGTSITFCRFRDEFERVAYIREITNTNSEILMQFDELREGEEIAKNGAKGN